MTNENAPPGWYHAEGDPPDTQRYWDGSQWVGSPVPSNATPAYGRAAPATSATGMVLADPVQRIIARLIDAVLMGIVGGIVAVILFGFADGDYAFFLGFALVGVLYEVGLIATRGATVGKMAMGIKVVTADGISPPGWQPAVMRWAINLVGVIPILGGLINLVVTIVSLVFLFTDPERRAVWDRIANTRVIKAK